MVMKDFAVPDWSMRAFSDAQRQVIRTLAHYLVQIAERLHLFENDVARERLIEDARSQWHGRAMFEWKIETVDSDHAPSFGEQLSFSALNSFVEPDSVIAETEVGFHLCFPT